MSIKFDRKFVNKLKKGEVLEDAEFEAFKTIFESQSILRDVKKEPEQENVIKGEEAKEDKKTETKVEETTKEEVKSEPVAEKPTDIKLENGDAKKETELELTEEDVLRNKVRFLEEQLSKKNLIKNVGESGQPASKSKNGQNFINSIR